MSCTPQITPEKRTYNPDDPVFKPIPVGKTFTVDEVRLIPEQYIATEILVAAHGFSGTARYTYDTSSTLADDGAAVLRPVWRTADEPGRWLKEELGGLGTHLTDPNPHPQYQLTSEKAQPNGYPSLDAGTKVPVAQIPNLPASQITSGQLALARGGTNADLSGTGGVARILKQLSAGAAITVDTLQASEVPSGIDATKIGGGNVDNTEFGHLDGIVSNIQAQLDALGQGIKWKNSVRAASLADVNIASAPASLDGVAGVNGDRWLLKDQAAPAENGIRIFNGAGNPLARSADADAATELEAAVVGIEEGTQAGDLYRQSEVNFVLDTDPITWVWFQSLSDLVAGDGLTKTGDTIHVGAGDGIEVTATEVTVKLDGTTLAKSAAGLKVDPATLAGFIEKTGLTEQDEQTAWPTTPAADKWIEQFMPRGRYIIDDFGRVIGPLSDGPRHHRSVMAWQKTGGKQARLRIGHDTDITATGTEAESLDADGQFLKYTSAAAINADAGWQQATFNYVARQNRPVIDFVIKTGDRITDIRIWNAYTSADLMASGTPGTVHLMGVRFDSALDGGVGNWVFVTGDGSGSSQNSDTGVPIAPDTKYHFRLECLDSGEVVLYCDDIPVVVHGAGDFLPGITQMLGLQSESRTLDVVPAIDDVYHKIQRIAVEYDG